MKTANEIRDLAKKAFPIREQDDYNEFRQQGYCSGFQDGLLDKIGLQWLKVDPSNLPSGDVLARSHEGEMISGELLTNRHNGVINCKRRHFLLHGIEYYILISSLLSIPKEP